MRRWANSSGCICLPPYAGGVWGGASWLLSRWRRGHWAFGASSSKPASGRPPPSRSIEQLASTQSRSTGDTASPRKPAYVLARTSWSTTRDSRRGRAQHEIGADGRLRHPQFNSKSLDLLGHDFSWPNRTAWRRTRQGFATERAALAPRRARINPSRTSTNRHPSNARKRPNIAAYLNSKRRSTSSSHVPCVESRAPRHERAAPQAVAADGAARRR